MYHSSSSFLNFSQTHWWKPSPLWRPLFHGNPLLNFTCVPCISCNAIHILATATTLWTRSLKQCIASHSTWFYKKRICAYIRTVQSIWPLRQIFIYGQLRRIKLCQTDANGPNQGRTNRPTDSLFAVVTKFYTADTNICPTSVCNLLYITFLAPWILELLLEF